MKRIITLVLLLVSFLIGTSQMNAQPITMEMSGSIGEYPAVIVLTINKGKATGYYEFNSSNAPQSGRITLSGTYKSDPDPDMPGYPWFKGTLTAKNASGTIVGKWNVTFETRTGSIEGTCTINGKRYDLVAEEDY